MKQSLVSIIVPVYNTAIFLEECLDSIRKQTYQNLDILLIDDGSSDDSSVICNKFTKQDLRFRYYYQDNSGVSVARNNGIRRANGKYICFVDSDDYVSPNYIEHLVTSISIQNADLALSGWVSMCEGNELDKVEFSEAIYIRSDFYKSIVEQNLLVRGGGVSKLYKTELIRNNNLVFDVTMSYAEDLNFLLLYILVADTISFTSSVDYFYRVGRSSTLSRCKNSFEEEFNCFQKTQISYQKIIEYMHLKEHENACGILFGSFWFYLIRAANAACDFEKGNIDSIKNIFANVELGDISILSQYYTPYCKVDAVQFKLLKSGFYRLFYYFNRLLFMLS